MDVEVRLYEAALSTRKEHYRDLMERWRAVEGKAQGGIATTGILIAGILAFIRELEIDATRLERTLLALLLISSVLAMLLGVAALWVRTVSEAPFAISVDPLTMDVLRDSNFSEEDWRDLLREQTKLWGVTASQLHKANQIKARFVVLGQAALSIAALLAVVFCLIRILDPSSGSGTV